MLLIEKSSKTKLRDERIDAHELPLNALSMSFFCPELVLDTPDWLGALCQPSGAQWWSQIPRAFCPVADRMAKVAAAEQKGASSSLTEWSSDLCLLPMIMEPFK